MKRFLMEAYCFKCLMKREIEDPKQVALKNGKLATKGNLIYAGGDLP